MCCSLSLCKTCQTNVLRAQIWVWNLQLLPVLLLCPCIRGSQLNGLKIKPLHLNNRVKELRQRLYCPQCWKYLPSGPLKKLEISPREHYYSCESHSWDPWHSPSGRNCWWCASNPWTKYRHPLRYFLAIWNVSMLCMRYNLNNKNLK